MLDSTRKKIILLGFICCTYIVILSLFVHYENINLDKLKTITNNLDNSPILDISLSENGKCNNSKKMILGHHKTKIENCNCNGKFHIGFCTYEELRNGCITIKPKKINNLYIWKGNEFCIKTFHLSYLDLLNHIIDKDNKCKIGFKNCGFIDTLQNKLCLKENLNCPINNIEFSNSKIPSNDKLKYNTLILKNNKYLHFTNEDINNNIITSLTFSKEKNETKNHFDKKRYNLLDKELKKNLLQDNMLYISDKNFTNENIGLYSNTFYGFKLSFLKHHYNFKSILVELKNYREISIFWETIICILILIILINELLTIGKNNDDNFDLLKLILFNIIKFSISCCFCYFTLVEFLKIANFGLPDKESDEYVNKIFKNYNKELTIVCLFAFSKFLVSVVLIVVIIINIFEGDCKNLFDGDNKIEYNPLEQIDEE